MPFRIGLAFMIDEKSSDITDGLKRLMDMHRKNLMLSGIPETLSIIDRLSKGLEITHAEVISCNTPKFTEDILKATDDGALTGDEMADIVVTMVLFRGMFEEQMIAPRSITQMFRQYTQFGGMQ